MKRVGDFYVPDVETQQVEALAAGGWQLDHLEAALAFVTDWSLAVDGGAHVGSWSRAMSARFEVVHAIEPHPEHLMCLKANIWGNPKVVVHEVALGEAPGIATMREDLRYEGGNTGGRHIYETGVGDIKIVTLDSLELPSLGFLKLDVEGYEAYALRGAAQTLDRFRPIVMIEDKPRMAFRYRQKTRAARRFLEKMGAQELGSCGADRIFGWRS